MTNHTRTPTTKITTTTTTHLHPPQPLHQPQPPQLSAANPPFGARGTRRSHNPPLHSSS
ncbi:unnamed protein product [Periconia digitata]|uniref:Uncharacterized protein n=1 Tax=Periconia digitata TaxID=1303443 RepID=A0A9W4UHJ5_9PLEO|nr:unnamed protein product [Periconia digitata]